MEGNISMINDRFSEFPLYVSDDILEDFVGATNEAAGLIIQTLSRQQLQGLCFEITMK